METVTESDGSLNAAYQVFHISELLELILLQLAPRTGSSIHEEINATRTLLLNRTVCRTWHALLSTSSPLRRSLYLTTLSASENVVDTAYTKKTISPPAKPNPWIPNILLSQRSWGSAYPFDNAASQLFNLTPFTPSVPKPRYWTFHLELSRPQYARLPTSGPWRDMLATQPPFRDLWCSRCFYELGSGRAPFVTHLDYDSRKPKTEQRFTRRCEGGVTLGAIVDAVGEVMEQYPNAKWVMVESLRVGNDSGEESLARVDDDQPVTRAYMPGSSSEREFGFQREHYLH
ncbi:hypothetical protein BAUCODRAFT_467708 [Baudoinia panamericana UAMH 10762]|uniref:F-box domain-containing protein n=1 Tax=Baudoinia panamericana (strain UAMH 10762) TaxID=717646 RepID=M2LPC1_BAUPA|nr:uncharacterized protein BAUCODRAFT_467708 [Baudoinia panamericana UAMH 10762]EMC96237.1 hypothetical protein BAUCODRAFT_467708 [Baudoinia panamericana UAMH 10762]